MHFSFNAWQTWRIATEQITQALDAVQDLPRDVAGVYRRLAKSRLVGLPVTWVLVPCDQVQSRHMGSRQSYSAAKSLSKSSPDRLAPSSVNQTDLFFVAGSDM